MPAENYTSARRRLPQPPSTPEQGSQGSNSHVEPTVPDVGIPTLENINDLLWPFMPREIPPGYDAPDINLANILVDIEDAFFEPYGRCPATRKSINVPGHRVKIANDETGNYIQMLFTMSMNGHPVSLRVKVDRRRWDQEIPGKPLFTPNEVREAILIVSGVPQDWSQATKFARLPKIKY